MRIVVAPNALKGSLSAAQAADAMRTGIHNIIPDADVQSIPVSDGGDGLIETLRTPLAAESHNLTVSSPLGDPIQAEFLYVPTRRLAVIEMATAAGLALISEHRLDALAASSVGVGQLIDAALHLGARHIVLGIGGSATTDGATGLASALGIRFLDKSGKALAGTGRNLPYIQRIDRGQEDVRLKAAKIQLACDVDNPLLGQHGAAQVYSPQKGANPKQVQLLERGLENFAQVLEQETGLDIRNLAGGGAAGGMGAGMFALFDAELKPGAQLVMELLDLETAITGADLVLTCEGRLDQQTRFGKAPAAVARLAARHQVPCIAIAGGLEESAYTLHDLGFNAVFSLCPGPISLREAVDNAAKYLTRTTEQIVRCIILSQCG